MAVPYFIIVYLSFLVLRDHGLSVVYILKIVSRSCAGGSPVVWHLSLMNSFTKTAAAIFLCRICFMRATLFSVEFNLQNVLHMVLSACVAAVQCRPQLHHSVVIFVWSIGIMDCIMFTFEKNRVPLKH